MRIIETMEWKQLAESRLMWRNLVEVVAILMKRNLIYCHVSADNMEASPANLKDAVLCDSVGYLYILV